MHFFIFYVCIYFYVFFMSFLLMTYCAAEKLNFLQDKYSSDQSIYLNKGVSSRSFLHGCDRMIGDTIRLTDLLLAAAVRHVWLERHWSRSLWDLDELHPPKLRDTFKRPVI